MGFRCRWPHTHHHYCPSQFQTDATKQSKCWLFCSRDIELFIAGRTNEWFTNHLGRRYNGSTTIPERVTSRWARLSGKPGPAAFYRPWKKSTKKDPINQSHIAKISKGSNFMMCRCWSTMTPSQIFHLCARRGSLSFWRCCNRSLEVRYHTELRIHYLIFLEDKHAKTIKFEEQCQRVPKSLSQIFWCDLSFLWSAFPQTHHHQISSSNKSSFFLTVSVLKRKVRAYPCKVW